MPVNFEKIILGAEYDRPELASLWGLAGWQAFSKGAFTPVGLKTIVLFVTQNNQKSLPSYYFKFIGDEMEWEGSEGHQSDRRISESKRAGDEIHLFYREHAHSTFTYYGQVHLKSATLRTDRPSLFVFETQKSEVEALNAIVIEQIANGEAPSDIDPQSEGARRIRQHVVYERSKVNRANAIRIHGRKCKTCDFDFNVFYGPERASGYIEVHHIESIASGEKKIDPANDLVPLCANCHRMIHRKRGEPLPIIELKKIIEKAKR